MNIHSEAPTSINVVSQDKKQIQKMYENVWSNIKQEQQPLSKTNTT